MVVYWWFGWGEILGGCLLERGAFIGVNKVDYLLGIVTGVVDCTARVVCGGACVTVPLLLLTLVWWTNGINTLIWSFFSVAIGGSVMVSVFGCLVDGLVVSSGLGCLVDVVTDEGFWVAVFGSVVTVWFKKHYWIN